LLLPENDSCLLNENWWETYVRTLLFSLSNKDTFVFYLIIIEPSLFLHWRWALPHLPCLSIVMIINNSDNFYVYVEQHTRWLLCLHVVYFLQGFQAHGTKTSDDYRKFIAILRETQINHLYPHSSSSTVHLFRLYWFSLFIEWIFYWFLVIPADTLPIVQSAYKSMFESLLFTNMSNRYATLSNECNMKNKHNDKHFRYVFDSF
jgi:hypothetical protein